MRMYSAACWVNSFLLVAAVAALAPQRIAAQPPASPASTCGQPLPRPVMTLPMVGGVYHPTPTRDGCWVFFAFNNREKATGIAALRRTAQGFEEVRTVPVFVTPLGLGGLALSGDQKLLIASYGQELTFIDVEKFTSGIGDPLLGRITSPRLSATFGLTISPDDKYAFAVQRGTAWIAVVDLEKARTSGFNQAALIGGVPTGVQPLMPAVSPDGRYLFSTSIRAPDVIGGPRSCNNGTAFEGAIQITDVQRAVTNPADATVGFAVPAGCSPNAVTVSPDGARLSNTAAGDIYNASTPAAENALIVFDARPIHAGKPAMVVGKVPVPKGPIAVVDTGTKLVLGFFGQPGTPDNMEKARLIVVDPAKVASGEAAILGRLPVTAGQLSLSADRRVLYGGGGVGLVVVDLELAPLEPYVR